jgi:hypothetical protein
MKIKLYAGSEKSKQVIAEIVAQDEPYQVRGPGLIQVESLGSSLVEVFNITRGQVIGATENVSGQSTTHFQTDMVNSITENLWQKTNSPTKGVAILEEFKKLCKLEVPAKYEGDYRWLLAKHRQIFSLNQNDIGYCHTILHKVFLKTEEPVYVKQCKIPEAHQHYLQEQV